ncbi:response regulator transcription factor [Streptacidiphilus jiangxiensis]|uniref:DNA-binding response regulator, OmpR family, contains REC and winged-helix (WHTH) domain n=1 Tax=Streptacidiphilus jiangxiensis TaxID=235985 RepID=A0A1H7L1C3_STRJI|nr:response regulator transcription factor [Streptacidiphilus jiangxiensis]SEK92526.1 DNA-binding response regulator, OmpR family, contains REC and winged-helix (wHTH) domain [Streptacidiphilus jiangxiensis]
MRVLVAEDEAVLAELVAEGLRAHAMAVDVVLDGDDALERLDVNDYDVLVLDRDLPGTHGDEVCRELVRRGARTRVLMLTAYAGVGDLVEGLGLGADDYLGKPFDYEELVARVQALGRRAGRALPPVLRVGGLVLDPPRRQASRDGRHLRLSLKEFAVLRELMAAEGAVVSTEELLERAWDENADMFTNAVRITMSRLRAKLGEPPIIETLTGVGYRIRTESPA